MKFQILVSTVDNNFNILRNLKRNDLNALIINQLISINKENSIKTSKNIKILSFKEKGLSKSRNKAIEYAEADICLITDNDVEFMENLKEKILHAFKENPDADILTFKILTPEGDEYKKYSKKSFYHNKRTIMKVSSIEIAFKREKIIKHNIKFDENFGLGTDFPTGEENIFLADALKKGLKVKYVPISIVIHPRESSGSNYNNEVLIKAKGAMFYRIFGIKGYFISLLFALKKFKYSKKYNLFSFYKFMLKGIKEYKKTKGKI